MTGGYLGQGVGGVDEIGDWGKEAQIAVIIYMSHRDKSTADRVWSIIL